MARVPIRPPAVTTGPVPQAVKRAVETAIEANPDRPWGPPKRREEVYRREYEAGLRALADGWVSVCVAQVRAASRDEDPNPLSAKWVRDTLFGPPQQRLALDKTERQVITVRVRPVNDGPELLAPAPPVLAEYTELSIEDGS